MVETMSSTMAAGARRQCTADQLVGSNEAVRKRDAGPASHPQ